MTKGSAFRTANLAALVDQRLAKYEIQEKISEGGFGTVYRAYDPVIKRAVAIKTCTTHDAEIRDRFLREAEIAGNLDHPNIVKVFDVGFEDGLPFIVQELLSGEDLDRIIARRQILTHPEKLLALLQIARGLEYAHSQGVVHRDVKPANVRILDDGTAKILDFGIATLQQENSTLTQDGMTVGTAAYLAPEQVKGVAATPQTDIFSYGVLAYELLSGVRPFGGETISSVLFQIVNQTPTPLSTHCPQVQPLLTGLVHRCLRKDPQQRPPGFGEILTHLERAREEERRYPVSVRLRPDRSQGALPGPRRAERPRRPERKLSEVRLEPVPAQPRDLSGGLKPQPARAAGARPWLWLVLALTGVIGGWFWQAEVRGKALLEELVAELPSYRTDSTPSRPPVAPPSEEPRPPSPPAVESEDEPVGPTTSGSPPASSPEDLPETTPQLESSSEKSAPPSQPSLPEPEAGPASLRITAAWHPKMTVSVDGGPPIPLSKATSRTLPAGPHTLTFSLLTTNFRAVQTVSVELAPASRRTVTPPIERPGALTIQPRLGSPQAQVLVDGQSIGVSPLRRLFYPAGSYRITLSSRDRSLETTVTLQNGRETILTFDLQHSDEFLLRHRPLDPSHSVWREP